MGEGIVLRKQKSFAPPAGAPSIYLKGMSDNIAVQFPMWISDGSDKLRTVTWWAENGLIKYIVDQTQEYGAMSWRKAARRVLAVSEMVLRSSEEGHYRDERIRLQQFVADMENVIRTAKAQGGGPFTDDELRDRKRRRPTSVVIPQEVDLSFM